MANCPRLAAAMAKTFPTVDKARAQFHIDAYRQRRNKGGPDWEGNNSFFTRVVKIAFNCRRH